jgi:hypothetical protein
MLLPLGSVALAAVMRRFLSLTAVEMFSSFDARGAFETKSLTSGELRL